MAEENNSAVSESDSFGRVGELWGYVRPVEGPVIVRPAVAGRCFVTQIDPRLRGMTTPVAGDLLLWCTPGQPHRIHGHTRANLPLTHQRLVPRRETLVSFRVLRDARPGRSTTGEDQDDGRDAEHRCARRESTPHNARKILAAAELRVKPCGS